MRVADAIEKFSSKKLITRLFLLFVVIVDRNTLYTTVTPSLSVRHPWPPPHTYTGTHTNTHTHNHNLTTTTVHPKPVPHALPPWTRATKFTSACSVSSGVPQPPTHSPSCTVLATAASACVSRSPARGGAAGNSTVPEFRDFAAQPPVPAGRLHLDRLHICRPGRLRPRALTPMSKWAMPPFILHAGIISPPCGVRAAPAKAEKLQAERSAWPFVATRWHRC